MYSVHSKEARYTVHSTVCTVKYVQSNSVVYLSLCLQFTIFWKPGALVLDYTLQFVFFTVCSNVHFCVWVVDWLYLCVVVHLLQSTYAIYSHCSLPCSSDLQLFLGNQNESWSCPYLIFDRDATCIIWLLCEKSARCEIFQIEHQKCIFCIHFKGICRYFIFL